MKQIVLLAALLPLMLAAGNNLIPNSGFEEGLKFWSYEEWKGLPVPGRLEKKDSSGTGRCFVLTDPGNMSMRYFRSGAFQVDPAKRYVLRCRLAGENLRPGDIDIRILQYGPVVNRKSSAMGWVSPKNRPDGMLFQDISGTFASRTFEIELPPGSITPGTVTATVFFHHRNPSFGELRIGEVEFFEK